MAKPAVGHKLWNPNNFDWANSLNLFNREASIEPPCSSKRRCYRPAQITAWTAQMSFSPLVNELIESLRVLPGVGRKSAQRMALYLLERNRVGGKRLSDVLAKAMDGIGYCRDCRSLSETEVCPLCSDLRRDDTVLCVVGSPADVHAVEQTGFKGRYFVLKGNLSPLDGLGPEAIGIPDLWARILRGTFGEIIVATSPTVEGDATAHYIAQMLLPKGIAITRLANGVPLGGELDAIDGGTLAHALNGRKPMAL